MFLWFSITYFTVYLLHRSIHCYFFRLLLSILFLFIYFISLLWIMQLFFFSRVDSYHIQTTHITAFKNSTCNAAAAAAVSITFFLLYCFAVDSWYTNTLQLTFKSLDKLGFLFDCLYNCRKICARHIKFAYLVFINFKCTTNSVILIEFLLGIDV